MPNRLTPETEGEGISQRQFYEAMQVIRDQIDERHRSMRASMEDRFDKVLAKMDIHEAKDIAVEKRVSIIETERKSEAKQALKQSTYIALVVSAGLTGLLQIGGKVIAALKGTP